MYTISTKDAYYDCWCMGRSLPIGEDYVYDDERVKEIAKELKELEDKISELKYELRDIWLEDNN
mgnify:CR=1 FL=1